MHTFIWYNSSYQMKEYVMEKEFNELLKSSKKVIGDVEKKLKILALT